MEPIQATSTIIDGRYRILGRLGQGSSGTTYAAEVLASGHVIALKELSLRGLQDWKKIELFEREARILKTLSHRAIPQYIDFFQVDTADNRWFYLAQDLAEGTSLADWVEGNGWVDEAEARRIAAAVLNVLIYLHGLNPPVIHRDLKPQNIIRRDDGHIYLVDFGAVQTVYRNSLRQGSTVVGTYGYMAPEQFRGQAVPATDLYGLGATLLFLLTHQSPADLPQERLRINFRSYVAVSAAFADWLEQLLDPLVEDRFASAQVALIALSHPTPRRLAPRPPVGTRVQLQASPTELSIYIPHPGLRGLSPVHVLLGLFVIFPSLLGLVITAFMALGVWLLVILLALMAMLHFDVVKVDSQIDDLLGYVYLGMGHVHLRIDRQRFSLTRHRRRRTRLIEGYTADLVKVELQTPYYSNDDPVKTIVLMEGANQHKFGTHLTSVEKVWLVDEIEAFIQKVVP